MAHMALYRKWRPMTFDEVVEQRHIVTTLKNSIRNNTVSHAYLFCGTRGTGKTTLAKIFARAINCLGPEDGNPCNKCACCTGILDGTILDVIEIDAASNNGVDDVREIKEAIMYVPAVTRYKVYIIDEVHMLSTGAFNALLKTLEEPPENVVFILATTEPHKLPATILSRCQRFDFKRITMSGLEGRLKIIAESCGISVEKSAVQLIARLSEGGMRDAISLLDQCMAQGKTEISYRDVVEIAGLSAYEAVNTFAHAIISKDAPAALNAIKTAMDQGRDLKPLCNQLIEWFRNLMLIKTGGQALDLVSLSDEEKKPLEEAAENLSLSETLSIIKELSETENRLRWSENQRTVMEVSAVRLCSYGAMSHDKSDLADLEARIGQLERKLSQMTAPGSRAISTETQKPSDKPPEKEKAKSREKEMPVKKVDLGAAGDNELKQWPDIIEKVRLMKKMKVYAYLLDTRCYLSDGTANVVVPGDDALKKTVLSRNESLEVITEAISDTLGFPVNVKIIDENKFINQSDQGNDDPLLERIKQFATENGIPLKIEE
jgi:DNA polymerase-3 subunit gamma/tau